MSLPQHAGNAMTTADWALILSVLSFLISLAAFIWNVWSKFIYPRGKLAVRISFLLLMNGDGSEPAETIALSAVNHGPTELKINHYVARARGGHLFRRRSAIHALLSAVDHPYTNRRVGEYASGFPKKLAVGEEVTVYLHPADPRRWLEEDFYYFGFVDSFGRHIWCGERNARKFRADVIKKTGVRPPASQSILDEIKDVGRIIFQRVRGLF